MQVPGRIFALPAKKEGEEKRREEGRKEGEREGREKNTYKHLYKHLFIILASSLLSACCFLFFLPLADLSCVSDSRWWFFTAKRPKFCTCIFSDTPTVPSLLCKMDNKQFLFIADASQVCCRNSLSNSS